MPHQCTSCGRTFADGSKEMLSGCPDCGGNKFQFMPAGAVDGDPGGAGGHGTGTQRRGAGGTAPKKRPDDAGGGVASTSGATSGSAPETRGDRGRGTDDRGAVNRAAATVREWVSSRGDDDDRERNETNDRSRKRDRAQNPDEPADRATDEVSETPEDAAPEDSAQASARRDVVSEDELPKNPPETDHTADDPDRSSQSAGEPTSTPAEPPEASPTNAPVSSAEDGAEVVDAPDDRNPGLEELREELNSQFESIRIVNPGQYELNLMELYEREEYIISLQEDGKYVIEVPDAWDAADR